MHFIEEDSIIVGRACPAVVILGVCAWVFLVYGRAFFLWAGPPLIAILGCAKVQRNWFQDHTSKFWLQD